MGGLCAGFFGVFQFSCRQSFAARTGELLARQHALAVALADDMAAVLAARPEALGVLWQDTGLDARREGLALAVWYGGAPRYNDLALDALPEAGTLEAGLRSWQVRVVGGRHLFYATTALAGELTGYAVTVQADIEDFYADWQRTGAAFAGGRGRDRRGVRGRAVRRAAPHEPPAARADRDRPRPCGRGL